MSEHYFTSDPSAPIERRTIRARLGGRELELATANAVFSPEHVDKGTGILLAEVPEPPREGAGLDLGCGWGPIALDLALRSGPEGDEPGLEVWAVDVNERALELCRENAERHAPGRIRAVTPEQVPSDLRFATIWSNPPIRIGKAALHELLETWMPRLEWGGEAWLVVAKQLGADSLQAWIAERFAGELEVERAETAKGFRILRVERVAEERLAEDRGAEDQASA